MRHLFCFLIFRRRGRKKNKKKLKKNCRCRHVRGSLTTAGPLERSQTLGAKEEEEISPTQSLPVGLVPYNLVERLHAFNRNQAGQIGKEGAKPRQNKFSARLAACQYICFVTPPVNSRNANCIERSPTSARSAERGASERGRHPAARRNSNEAFCRHRRCSLRPRPESPARPGTASAMLCRVGKACREAAADARLRCATSCDAAGDTRMGTRGCVAPP